MGKAPQPPHYWTDELEEYNQYDFVADLKLLDLKKTTCRFTGKPAYSRTGNWKYAGVRQSGYSE